MRRPAAAGGKEIAVRKSRGHERLSKFAVARNRCPTGEPARGRAAAQAAQGSGLIDAEFLVGVHRLHAGGALLFLKDYVVDAELAVALERLDFFD